MLKGFPVDMGRTVVLHVDDEGRDLSVIVSERRVPLGVSAGPSFPWIPWSDGEERQGHPDVGVRPTLPAHHLAITMLDAPRPRTLQSRHRNPSGR